MGRKFWEFRNATEPGVGDLLIYGNIGSDDGMGWMFDDVTPKQFRQDLDALGAISELRVFINSPGGDVFAGQAIHSILKRHEAKITVFVDGLAASIAAVVAMAGDRVIMPRNAMMMIHNPWTLAIGDSEEFRKLADTLDSIRETIVAAFEGKTGMDREELLPLLDAETWLTAEDAVRMGFADEIEESKQIAASMRGKGKMIINGVDVDLERFNSFPADWPLDVHTSIQSVAAVDTRPIIFGENYSSQGDGLVAAVLEYETRTERRLAAREKSGRALSDGDVKRWEDLKGAADRALGVVTRSAEQPSQTAEETIAIEIEKQRLVALSGGMA